MTTRILECRFHPQIWINGYAVEVDPQGETDWKYDTRFDDPIPDDDSFESDGLRFGALAPQWIREWSGPFWVEILNREEVAP